MAEPIAVHPPQVTPAASERDVLLATKLHLPPARPGLVLRPRLAVRLDVGLQQPLLVVVAPAGYGKTVLLSEWVRQTELPVAWLSLDPSDSDPTRFWRHVLAALERLHPGVDRRLGPMLGPPAPGSLEPLVTTLINVLSADSDKGALLVLDDYHVITSSEVHSSLRYLLEHPPAGLHLVVASRSDPPLTLARLRARGQLVELRADDLRFTVDEAGLLLRRLDANDALPESIVTALAARTEGWGAGLHLAGLSLRGQSDVAGFVANFTGSHRYVMDYLTGEVLERQPEDVRRFLLETSVLERLSGPLCDAVIGGMGSQSRLEQVERDGLFLVPLDDVRGWWRYHHLFADLLRARMKRDAVRTAQLHRSAAAWYEERGLADDAIHHALAAGDAVWAARLIENHFDTVFNLRGEEATIQRWLPALPDEVVSTRPRLLLAQAQMAAMRGDVTTMERLVDAGERTAANAIGDGFESTAGIGGSLLVNVPAVIALQRSYLAQLRGDAEATATYTQRAMSLVGDGELMLRSAIEGFFVVAEWLRGHLDVAEQTLASNVSGWRADGQVTTAAWGAYALARIQRARGCLDASARTSDQALDFAATPGEGLRPAAGPALVGLAEVAYQRNDLDAATAYITPGIALCREFVHTPPLASGLVTLAWIRQATGDPGAARAAMNEAIRFAPGPPGLLNPVPAQRARLQLAQGDLAGAQRWISELGIDASDAIDYPNEASHLILARVLTATGCADQALGLIDCLLESALDDDRAASIIELRCLQAIALTANGHAEEAMTAVADALALAEPRGYVRVFLDEGPALAELIRRAQPTQSAPAPVTSSDLIEQLTNRELEVLAILATGKSNQAIADELVVSLDTVKKHLSHIMTKLGVANRTEAVARARTLGLVE